MNIAGHTILSITQVNNQVKFAVEQKFSNLWIKAEIASCKPYPSGHIYLTLKDEISELTAVIFAQYARNLSYLPEPGLQVTVNGDLSIYSPKGQFQLLIKNLYPLGQGELWLEYEALKKKLEAEGIFDLKHKKTIARFPKKIGIITSKEGAAIRDIIQVLNRRAPHIFILLYPVPVQGKDAGEKIAAAVEDMNLYGGLDTIIISRGGGSLEDLWCFNKEVVARAIFNSEIPIISAVGHETDTTISDYAADYRAPTPSAAAEIVAESRYDLFQIVDNMEERLKSTSEQIIHSFREKVKNLQNRHGFFKPQIVLQHWIENIKVKNHQLQQLIENHLQNKLNIFESYQGKLELLNPRANLERGYAIAVDKNKQIIFSSKQVKTNEIIQLYLAEGKLESKVMHRKVKNG